MTAILITVIILCLWGANRGLGLSLVRQALSRHQEYDKVIACCRTTDGGDLTSLAEANPERSVIINIRDLSDEGTIDVSCRVP
jgi:NAD(P)-dependent dehydrogenase (short-subunit alcohol dehydrogenase family)